MFESPGSKIKTLASVLFAVCGIGSVILAIVVGNIGHDFNVGSFFTILVGGPVISYVSCLFLSAIGQLCEDVEDIRIQTFNIYRMRKDNSQASSGSKSDLTPKSPSEARWDCKHCGKDNPQWTSQCTKCGASRYK